jgi:polyprenyldihydroxybenzoate methyltransferase / 3-demethylubiquinol 3-O-methyltransferase
MSSEGHPIGQSVPLEYKHTSAEDLLREFGPSSFDVVCSMEVLEHVNNPRGFLDSCAQLVKVLIDVYILLTVSSLTLIFYLIAWGAPVPINNCSHTTGLFSHHFHGRRHA